MKKLFKNLLGYILYGFIFWFPIILFVIVLVYCFNLLEGTGKALFNIFFPDQPVHVGFVTLTCILFVLLTGLALKKIPVSRFMSKIPFLGLFFGEGQIMTFERLSHLQPCLFLLSPSCPSYGWILSEEKTKVGDEVDCSINYFNVYYPNVPTLITGSIFPIRKEMIIKLGNPSKEVIDLLLYASKSPPHLKHLPWPNEDKASFGKRAKLFGLNTSTG